MRQILGISLLAVAGTVGGLRAEPVVLVQTNALWRYFKGTQEASDPIDAWRQVGFDDSHWSEGRATFTYGPDGFQGTVLDDMRHNYRTVYLRTRFSVTSPADVENLELMAVVDDGFMAWINGQLVAQVRPPVGEPHFDSLAGSNAPEPQRFEVHPIADPAAVLRPGENVLAVQVFNVSPGSSDLVFDAELWAELRPPGPPRIVAVDPEPGPWPSLTRVSVTFSEPVTGVEARDFLINGAPATAVEGGGAVWTFTFEQPPYGTVFCSWEPDAGIMDLSVPPQPFDVAGPDATWTYQLYDASRPAVIEVNPPAGAVVRQLSQIEVLFDRPVLGVDAADLQIDGQPAASVTGVAAGPYLFRFEPKPAGQVQVAWAPSTGIVDAGPEAVRFLGGSWTYTVNPELDRPRVVITEFVAQNVSGLRDEDGQAEDWIEIQNQGETAVNLEGWALTDGPDLPGKWTFPPIILEPGQFLVVFASGKDRRPLGGRPCHTNFKLNREGEYLGLYDAESPRQALSELAPAFPEQRNDYAYGLDPTGRWRYFDEPTPGRANGLSGIEGLTEPVHFSVPRGYYRGPLTVSLSCPTPGAVIRYTTDGHTPTETVGQVYTGPITFNRTTVLRAAAFAPGRLPSRVETHSYLLNLGSSQLRLPALSLVTDRENLFGPTGIMEVEPRNTIYHGLAWERPVSAELVRPEDNGGFAVECGLRVQGGDYIRRSYDYRNPNPPQGKYSFRLYFRGDYGPGRLRYPLIPDIPVQEFDVISLRAGMNDATNPFLRDEFSRRLVADTGQIAPRGGFVHLFLNGEYKGYYNPTERIDGDFLQSYRGTSADYDIIAQGSQVQDGDRAAWDALMNFVRSRDLSDPANYQQLGQMLDLTNFADYLLVNIYANTGDWPHNNWRAARERRPGEKFFFIPWDAEWTYGFRQKIADNIFNDQLQRPSGTSGPEIRVLFWKLHDNPEWRLLFADRAHKHLYHGGTLSKERLLQIYRPLKNLLVGTIPGFNNTIESTWIPNRERYMTNHLAGVGLWLSALAPEFNQHGGRVPPGFEAVLTAPRGRIFYTTDGSDPHVPFTAQVAPAAREFLPGHPIPILEDTTIKARTLAEGEWSALSEATFRVQGFGSPLRIAEIMYNPPGGEAYEFIEILNTSAIDVDLTDVSLDGVEFHFLRGETLPGHGRLVLAADDDPAAFAARYPGVTPAGWFGGSLANGGERLELIAADGSVIVSVDYDDQDGWPVLADGGGHSLEIVDPLGDPDDPANWRASVLPGGSPGEPNPAPSLPPIRLNELMADNQSGWEVEGVFPDWIELFNDGEVAVDLAGWTLTDGVADHRFVFPAMELGPGEYLAVLAADEPAPGRLVTGFALKREGEFLELADAQGRRVDAVSFGQLPTDLTLGRVGEEGRWMLCDPTPEALNEPVELAPWTSLAVNELMADPVPGEDDWVELYNRDPQRPVALQGLWVGTETRLAAVGLPSFVPPHGFVVLRADEKPGPQHLDLRLPSGWGYVRLVDPLGNEFERVVYARTYEGVSYGRLPDGENTFAVFRGSVSPGQPNYSIAWEGPVLHEILARSRQPVPGGPAKAVDWIEIHNPSDQVWDLAGFTVAVGRPDPGQWVFPNGSVVEPGGFLVLLCDPEQPASTVRTDPLQLGRGLDGDGDAVYLLNPEGQVVDSVEFGPQLPDRSIGRAPNLWALLVRPTPGAANAESDPTSAYTLLRINEWQAAGVGADWLELYNPSDRPIALARLSLTDDPSLAGMQKYVFPPLSYIAPRGYLRLWADGRPQDGLDHLPFSLDALGEMLRLYTVSGIVIDQQVLLAAPATGSQGRFPDGAATILDFPDTPSPGAPNYRPHPAVVINEVLAQGAAPFEDAVEVLNLGAEPVDLGGWWLSDDSERLFKYAVPEGTILAPGTFVVFYQGQFNDPAAAAEPFTLAGDSSGRVFLSEVDAGGALTGYRATATWEPMGPGESWGRFETSLGAVFGPLATPTFGRDQPAGVAEFRLGRGAPNSPPRVGPIVISEIMYHPAEDLAGGEAAYLEFIELHNLSDLPVPLYQVEAGQTNGWRLEGGIEFEFGPITLPPHGWLLVTPEFPDTAAFNRFRARYGLEAEDLGRMTGPWRGRLANEGERIRLTRPGPRVLDADGRWRTPHLLVEQVDYRPEAPWPAAAGGSGLSLQRRELAGYGNDPVHWMPASPSPLGPLGAGAGDLDGDGLPDEWEWRHGLNLASAEGADGAEGDPDDDGLTNREEFLRGSDPTQTTLLFRRLWVQGDRVYLSFYATAGRLYRVEYSDELAGGDWRLLTNIDPRSRSGEVQFWTSMRPGGWPRFYRLVSY